MDPYIFVRALNDGIHAEIRIERYTFLILVREGPNDFCDFHLLSPNISSHVFRQSGPLTLICRLS